MTSEALKEEARKALKGLGPVLPFDLIDRLLTALEESEKDLDFAYKRAKVLADMLKIPIVDSPEVTGTILGMVRVSVERLIDQKETITTLEQKVQELEEENNKFTTINMENIGFQKRLIAQGRREAAEEIMWMIVYRSTCNHNSTIVDPYVPDASGLIAAIKSRFMGE